jgi:hypothetical protein
MTWQRFNKEREESGFMEIKLSWNSYQLSMSHKINCLWNYGMKLFIESGCFIKVSFHFIWHDSLGNNEMKFSSLSGDFMLQFPTHLDFRNSTEEFHHHETLSASMKLLSSLSSLIWCHISIINVHKTLMKSHWDWPYKRVRNETPGFIHQPRYNKFSNKKLQFPSWLMSYLISWSLWQCSISGYTIKPIYDKKLRWS